MNHEFDSSLTCNYCGKSAEKISKEAGNVPAELILCPVRRLKDINKQLEILDTIMQSCFNDCTYRVYSSRKEELIKEKLHYDAFFAQQNS